MSSDSDDAPSADDTSVSDEELGGEDTPGADLSDAEVEALHEIELGAEWLHRAHGHLVQFHHATGHGMDHLAEAERLLREVGREDLADRLRDDLLPRGVVGDQWSYGVLEAFQDGPLAAVTGFEADAREEVADGHRHVAERRQERTWKDRARE
jgi:hypothetical protein